MSGKQVSVLALEAGEHDLFVGIFVIDAEQPPIGVLAERE